MSILIIGDSCKDVFIYGKSERLCPDAPVPVFIKQSKIENGGMALNVYDNIRSIYDNVDIITNPNPITKTRYVESKNNHMFLRVDSEQKKLARIGDIKSIDLSKYSLVIISDYCKGFLDRKDIEYICNNHENVFIDTKKIIGDYCINAHVIKINEIEYNHNLEAMVDIDKFKEKLIVTLGSAGCQYRGKRYPVSNVEIKDMTGAGDTFISALAVMYLKSENMEKAINFANECATIVVQHKGVNKIGDFNILI